MSSLGIRAGRKETLVKRVARGLADLGGHGLVGLVGLLWLVGSGCERRQDDEPFLSRPALTAGDPLRLAFTARGRVWVARAPSAKSGDHGGEAWAATAVPGGAHQDRPVWTGDGSALGLSVWFEASQPDLAIFADGELQRLTATAGDELLDDVASDGRFLFERDGALFEMRVVREVGTDGVGRYRAGEADYLTPGRDARYTPDARHLLFVRGHSTEPLGLWRRGYRGGDDSEVFLLDLDSMEVTQLTENPDNDEFPLPLDDRGQRFIACRERFGPYQPWLVAVAGPRIHRVKRFPMPGGDWPVLFPALRPGPGAENEAFEEFEVWAEAGGRLFRTAGTVPEDGLDFTPAAEVRVKLGAAPEAGTLAAGGAASVDGERLFAELAERLATNPFTSERWRQIAEGERRRFRQELARAESRQVTGDLVARLLGRLGLPELYHTAAADEERVGFERRQAAATSLLARELASSGLTHLAAARGDELVPALIEVASTGASGIVLDLRGASSDLPVDALLLLLCDAPYDESRRQEAARLVGTHRIQSPLLVLIDGTTYGSAEIIADGLRTLGCGRLIGRPTAGVVVRTERHPLAAGGILVMPVAEVARRGGGVFDGRGLVPHVFVPARADPAAEPWLEAILAAAERRDPGDDR